MTITSDVTAIQIPGNGFATVFAAPMKIFAATDLIIGFVFGGVYSLQTSGYTVSDIDENKGCTITFGVPPALGVSIDIRTDTPQTQVTEFANLGQYLPSSTTDTCDRIVRILQDLTRKSYDYGIHGPDTETIPWPPVPNRATRPNMVLLFDLNGDLSVGVPTTQIITGSLIVSLLTQPQLGSILYPSVNAELLLNITPTNLIYPPGNVLRYGADSGGGLDCAASFLSAQQVATQGGYELAIPSGTYTAASTLAWGFSGLRVKAYGKVTIKSTVNNGRAITIDGGSGSGINDVRVEGFIRVVGNSTTTDAWFINACHRSWIQGIAGDCGVGFRIQWCVCTVFTLMCSINENGGTFPIQTPQAGMILDQRPGGGTVSGCTFINPIMEGITAGNGLGIDLIHTLQNNFQGGTSEGNKVGIFSETTSPPDNFGNTFVGIDFESNTLNDIAINAGAGGSHTFIGINSNSGSSNPNIDLAGGDNTSFIGGYLRQVNIRTGVSGTLVEGAQLSNNGLLGITGAGASGCRVMACTLVDGGRNVTGQVADQLGSTSNAFVPTILGAGTAGTQAYSTQKCTFTQYGAAGNGFVDFAIAFTLTANSGGSGNATVSLPVAARNIAGQLQTVMIGDYTGVTLGGLGRSLALRLSPGSTNAQLVESDSGSVNNLLAITAISTTATIIISGRYLI